MPIESIKRAARKVGMASRFSVNRRTKALNQTKRASHSSLIQVGLAGSGKYALSKDPSLQGRTQVLEQLDTERRRTQQEKNRARGKGKNSPYKLSGVRRDPKWIPTLRAVTSSRGGQFRAEERAFQKWLKQPAAKREATVKWIEENIDPLVRTRAQNKSEAEERAFQQWLGLPQPRQEEMMAWLERQGSRLRK